MLAIARTSEERLVKLKSNDAAGTEVNSVSPGNTQTSSLDSNQDKSTTPLVPGDVPNATNQDVPVSLAGAVEYRVYKRRWFGLIELILLNIMVSWGWLTYAPVANTSAVFFSTTPAAVNWLNVGFFFAFVVMSPLAHYILSKHGPRLSILFASAFLIVGNWIRYGGTRAIPPSYAGVMIGQILIGFAQPFVLAAPTSYSDLWYTPRGRITATAITTLANPFGGALGELIDPFLTVNPPDVAPMTLYIAIITTVTCLPSVFVPKAPPTPVAPSSDISRPPTLTQLRLLATSASFWLLFIPFIVYVGFFNSFSTLLTQFLTPYGFSETDSGIAGAVTILVGLVAAAISSPLVDRSKRYLLVIKLLVPLLAISYLIFIWAPPSRTIAFPYVMCALIGASSFVILPVSLEWFVEVSYPVSPALSSVLCWAAAQGLAAIFIIISEALIDGPNASLPNNPQRALIFEAVISLVVAPCALLLGVVGDTRKRRLEAGREEDQRAREVGL